MIKLSVMIPAALAATAVAMVFQMFAKRAGPFFEIVFNVLSIGLMCAGIVLLFLAVRREEESGETKLKDSDLKKFRK